MQSISSRIWTRVAVPISYNDNHYTTGTSYCKEMTDDKLLLLHSNSWNHLTLCKEISTGSFKNVINKMFTTHMYLIYMYKEDMALNNLQCLICHKTQPNQIIYI